MPEITGAMLPFIWAEDPSPAKLGDGISRPKPGSRTREYKLIVYPTGARPLTWITRAESKRDALRYARNRWPGADVEAA
jgi:hypothetical protein